MVNWKKLVIISASAGAAFALVFGLILARFTSYESPGKPRKPWKSNAIQATYVSAQLRETDKANASLILYYDLENNTDFDYRLADAPGFVIMSRLKSNNSLSSEEHVRLKYDVFLPARQRARIALELIRPFDWPAENDPTLQDKLKDFVNQRLANVEEFVLFDETDRCQIEFPRGWQDLPPVMAAQQ